MLSYVRTGIRGTCIQRTCLLSCTCMPMPCHGLCRVEGAGVVAEGLDVYGAQHYQILTVFKALSTQLRAFSFQLPFKLPNHSLQPRHPKVEGIQIWVVKHGRSGRSACHHIICFRVPANPRKFPHVPPQPDVLNSPLCTPIKSPKRVPEVVFPQVKPLEPLCAWLELGHWLLLLL